MNLLSSFYSDLYSTLSIDSNLALVDFRVDSTFLVVLCSLTIDLLVYLDVSGWDIFWISILVYIVSSLFFLIALLIGLSIA